MGSEISRILLHCRSQLACPMDQVPVGYLTQPYLEPGNAGIFETGFSHTMVLQGLKDIPSSSSSYSTHPDGIRSVNPEPVNLGVLRQVTSY